MKQQVLFIAGDVVLSQALLKRSIFGKGILVLAHFLALGYWLSAAYWFL